MPPTAALVLIGIIILLFVWCVIADRHNYDKFVDKFEIEHPYRATQGGMHVSKQDELIWEVVTGREIGYKVWKLKDVGYVETRTGEEKNTRFYAFRILNREKRLLGGKYYTASRRPVLQHAKRTFELPDEQSLRELADFVIAQGDNVECIDAGSEE